MACEYGKRKRPITDASGVIYGAVLHQEQDPDDFRPVMFLSRKLKGPETRYTATENEAGAIIFALRQLRAYLDGEKFEIFTDHMALKWLLDMQHPRPRLARWLLELQDFDFSVNYAPGNSEMLAVPDALSQYSFDPRTILCTRCLEVVGEIEEGEWGVESMIKAQTEEWGDLGKKAASKKAEVGKKKWLCMDPRSRSPRSGCCRL